MLGVLTVEEREAANSTAGLLRLVQLVVDLAGAARLAAGEVLPGQDAAAVQLRERGVEPVVVGRGGPGQLLGQVRRENLVGHRAGGVAHRPGIEPGVSEERASSSDLVGRRVPAALDLMSRAGLEALGE